MQKYSRSTWSNLKEIFVTLCSYHVQGNTIHKSQEMEATPVPADEWMDKQDVIYKHDRILLFKHEENSDTRLNMDQLWWHHANGGKPVTEKQKVVYFTYMRCPE